MAGSNSDHDRTASTNTQSTRFGRVVLGNQLFLVSHTPPEVKDCPVFMAEDLGLCTYEKHHQQKLVLFLAAMRSYRDYLRQNDRDVTYHTLPTKPRKDQPYESKLKAFMDAHQLTGLCTFEVEDKFFAQRLQDFADKHDLDLRIDPSPMFLTPRDTFAEYLKEAKGKPFMARFYQQQRRRLNLLMDDNDEPRGGQWSFDEDNRERIPAEVDIPDTQPATPTPHVRDLIPVIQEHFADHPGSVTAEHWWLPTTRGQALDWLKAFFKQRFADFGPYEDALSKRGPFLWHSALTPLLNLGLLTPQEVIEKAVAYADTHDIPINSLEGFVRQIIGWREFIRGIYQNFSEQQHDANFFDHQRRLTDAWYDATTGIPHLDAVIDKAQRYGYAHHIERLMVAGNLMTLCEIHPHDAHRWFMEMFVDSSDWVMGPNVYGMGIFSDGGVLATKPYICGSNYLQKMSDPRPRSPRKKETRAAKADPGLFGENADWQDAVDGLYWRFIDKHRDFFKSNARMGTAVATFDKMNTQRRDRILNAAEKTIKRITQTG